MKVFCRGCSMIPVFRPGDLLECRIVSREQIRCGDVICFPGGDGQGIAHRVIRRTPDGFLTMGDNNPEQDRNPVCGESFPVAVAVRTHGRRLRVSGGRAGMMVFYKNRLRRRLRSIAGRLFSLLVPLCFWRISCGCLTKHVFEEEEQYDFRRRLVVRRRKDGTWDWSSPWWRLLIREMNHKDDKR